MHVNVCLLYPVEDGGELDERVLSVLAVSMRSKVLVLFLTLSAMVTRARRMEAGGMPLNWMRFSSQSKP